VATLTAITCLVPDDNDNYGIPITIVADQAGY